MRFLTSIFAVSATILPIVASPLVALRRDVDPSLVPQFGLQAGLNPTGTGDCDGINNAQGVPIKIPCSCPPDRDSFIASLNANVAAGHAVNNPSVQISFPTNNSQASQLARLNAATVTLQNLQGPGVGCPASSTTFTAQAIQAGTDVSAPQAPAPAVASSSSSTSSAGGVDPSLVPPFGLQSGLNPTGTGDCDGVPDAQGVPIKIPCSCPPDRQSFINSLNANVAAGHAVNNPTIQVSFPSDNSQASQLARLNTATVTLQNLFGPGAGCPAASTTFNAQRVAIQDEA